ncbi:MAG: hypothetical protein B7Z14_11830 [Bosea sp. 32-68-6]|nr:MAG: hypothetical protein B7Z14_11830 [Bosea sp. 32-68-6]
MSASIFSLNSLRLRRTTPVTSPKPDWTQQELAELYRVRDRLIQSGIAVSVDTGLTDECEPWAVFVHSETGEAFVHIARLDGDVVVANMTANVVYRGRDFRAITDQMLDAAPLVMPRAGPGDRKVIMHPRSVFTAFVAAAIVLSEFLRTIEPAKAAADHEKAVAETKALFPHLFERMMARDASWAPSGMTATAAALISAAVGAVLMSDHADAVDDDTTLNAAIAADSLDLRVVPVALAENKQASNEARPAEPELTNPMTDGEEVIGGAKIDISQGQKAEDRLAERVVEGAEAQAEGSPTPQQPSGLTAGAGDLAPDEALANRVVRANAVISDVADNATSATASTSTASEAPSTRTQEVVAKDFAVIVDAIVVARLPVGTSATSQIELAIDQALETQTQTVTTAVSQQAHPPQSNDMKATTVKLNTASSEWLLHTKVTVATPPSLVGGVHDVVLISEKMTVINGFRFNEDYLLVNGTIDRTDWIKTVEVSGDDVTITSVTGAEISLIDTHGLIA